MTTLLPFRRPAATAALATLLLGATLALTGCSEVAIIRSAPVAAAAFDAKFGNDPLAAADASSLQSALRLRGQLWDIKLHTEPAAAGNVNATNVTQLVAARGKVNSLGMTLTATSDSMQSTFSSRGSQGEQAYLESLLQAIAQAGYTHIRAVRVDVYFQSSHHSVLTWKPSTGFVYSVLDGKP